MSYPRLPWNIPFQPRSIASSKFGILVLKHLSALPAGVHGEIDWNAEYLSLELVRECIKFGDEQGVEFVRKSLMGSSEPVVRALTVMADNTPLSEEICTMIAKKYHDMQARSGGWFHLSARMVVFSHLAQNQPLIFAKVFPLTSIEFQKIFEKKRPELVIKS